MSPDVLGFLTKEDEQKRLSTFSAHLQVGQYELARGMVYSIWASGSRVGILKLLGDLVRWGCQRGDSNVDMAKYPGPCWYWWRIIPVGRTASIRSLFQFRLMVLRDFQRFAKFYNSEFGSDINASLPCPVERDDADKRSRDLPAFRSFLEFGTLICDLKAHVTEDVQKQLDALLSLYVVHYTKSLRTNAFKLHVTGEEPRPCTALEAAEVIFQIFETNQQSRAAAHAVLVETCRVMHSDGDELFHAFQKRQCEHVRRLPELEPVLESLSFMSISHELGTNEVADDAVPLELAYVEDLLRHVTTRFAPRYYDDENLSSIVQALFVTPRRTLVPVLHLVLDQRVRAGDIEKYLTPRNGLQWRSLLALSTSRQGSPFEITFRKALSVIDDYAARGPATDGNSLWSLDPLLSPAEMQPLRWLLLVALSTGVAGSLGRRRRVSFAPCFRRLAELPGEFPADPTLRFLCETAVFEAETQHAVAGMLVHAAQSPQGEAVVKSLEKGDLADALARAARRELCQASDADDECSDQVSRVAAVLSRMGTHTVSLLKTLQPFLPLLDLESAAQLAETRPVLFDRHDRHRRREVSLMHCIIAIESLLKSILRPRTASADVPAHIQSHLRKAPDAQVRLATMCLCLRVLYLKRSSLKNSGLDVPAASFAQYSRHDVGSPPKKKRVRVPGRAFLAEPDVVQSALLALKSLAEDMRREEEEGKKGSTKGSANPIFIKRLSGFISWTSMALCRIDVAMYTITRSVLDPVAGQATPRPGHILTMTECVLSRSLLSPTQYLAVALDNSDYQMAANICTTFTRKRKQTSHAIVVTREARLLRRLLNELRYSTARTRPKTPAEHLDRSIIAQLTQIQSDGDGESLHKSHLPPSVARNGELLPLAAMLVREPSLSEYVGQLCVQLLGRSGWWVSSREVWQRLIPEVGGPKSLIGRFLVYVDNASAATLAGPRLLSHTPRDHLRALLYQASRFEDAERYSALIGVDSQETALALLCEQRDNALTSPPLTVPVVKWLAKNLGNAVTLAACLVLQGGKVWDQSLLWQTAMLSSGLPSPCMARWTAMRFQTLTYFLKIYGRGKREDSLIRGRPAPLDTEGIADVLKRGGTDVHAAHHFKLPIIFELEEDEAEPDEDDDTSAESLVAVCVFDTIKTILGYAKTDKQPMTQIEQQSAFDITDEGLQLLPRILRSKSVPEEEFYSTLAEKYKFSASLDEALACLAHEDRTLDGPSDTSLADAAHLLLRTGLQLSKQRPTESKRLVTSASSLLQRVRNPRIIVNDFLLADQYTRVFSFDIVEALLSVVPHDERSVDDLRIRTSLHKELLKDPTTRPLVSNVMRLEQLPRSSADKIMAAVSDPTRAIALYRAFGIRDEDLLRQLHGKYLSALVNDGRFFDASLYLDGVAEKSGEEEAKEVCLAFATSPEESIEAKEIVAGLGGVQQEVTLGLRLLNSLSESQRSDMMSLVKRPDLFAEQLIRDGKIHNVHKALLDFPDVLRTDVLVFYAKKSMTLSPLPPKSPPATPRLPSPASSAYVVVNTPPSGSLTPQRPSSLRRTSTIPPARPVLQSEFIINQRLSTSSSRFSAGDAARQMFTYPQAPCLSLCRSLVLIMNDNQAAARVCLDVAEELGTHLTNKKPPVARKWVLCCMEEMCHLADQELVASEAGEGERGRLSSLLDRVLILKEIELNLGNPPFERSVPWELPDDALFRTLGVDDLLDEDVVERIVDGLVEWDRMELALSIAERCFASRDAVWVRWGRDALRLGWWEAAKDCFLKASPSEVYVCLPELQVFLEGPATQRHNEFSPDGSVTTPKVDPNGAIPTKKAAFAERQALNQLRYRMAVWMNEKFGAEEDMVSFFVRKGELGKAVSHAVQKQQDPAVFVQKVFKPVRHKSASLDLKAAFLKEDPSLSTCRDALFGICKYLSDHARRADATKRANLLEELLDWQLWMHDHVRCAVTCRDRFLTNKDSSNERQIKDMEAAEHAIKLAIEQKQPYVVFKPSPSPLASPAAAARKYLDFATSSGGDSYCSGDIVGGTDVFPTSATINIVPLVLDDAGIALPPSHLDPKALKAFFEVVELQKNALRILKDRPGSERLTLFSLNEAERQSIAEACLVQDFSVGFQMIRQLSLPRVATFRSSVTACIEKKDDKRAEYCLRQMKNTISAEELNDLVLECIEQVCLHRGRCLHQLYKASYRCQLFAEEKRENRGR
ncbi:hypothetical protein DIPPA_03022 [Diplonema papillatum]|nr:hypothetical protein DIPPA_03022 [Diplonema papillatum]